MTEFYKNLTYFSLLQSPPKLKHHLPPPRHHNPHPNNHRKTRKLVEKEEAEDTEEFANDHGVNGRPKYGTLTKLPASGSEHSTLQKTPPEHTTRRRSASVGTVPNSTSQKMSESYHRNSPNLSPGRRPSLRRHTSRIIGSTHSCCRMDRVCPGRNNPCLIKCYTLHR